MNLIIRKTKHIFVCTGLTLVPGWQNRKHMYGFGGGKTWGENAKWDERLRELILLPYPCTSHIYFDINFGDRLYSK